MNLETHIRQHRHRCVVDLLNVVSGERFVGETAPSGFHAVRQYAGLRVVQSVLLYGDLLCPQSLRAQEAHGFKVSAISSSEPAPRIPETDLRGDIIASSERTVPAGQSGSKEKIFRCSSTAQSQ